MVFSSYKAPWHSDKGFFFHLRGEIAALREPLDILGKLAVPVRNGRRIDEMAVS